MMNDKHQFSRWVTLIAAIGMCVFQPGFDRWIASGKPLLKQSPNAAQTTFSTYLGGNSSESIVTTLADSAGNSYVIGSTSSTDFPTLNAIQSTLTLPTVPGATVTKLDQTGKLVYSTYIAGRELLTIHDARVDAGGSLHLVGSTTAKNLPTFKAFQPENGGRRDLFAAKLDPTGSLVFLTYLGGRSNEEFKAFELDFAGNLFIAGTTLSANFPQKRAFQKKTDDPNRDGQIDVFVTKLDQTGKLVFSTPLGGTGSDAEALVAMKVDRSGNVVLAGTTDSGSFPVKKAFQPKRRGTTDVFVTKLDARGKAIYSTYLGGGAPDLVHGIALDQSDNVVVFGITNAVDYPTVNAFQSAYSGAEDIFLTKLNVIGGVVFSTLLGGSSNEHIGLPATYTNGLHIDSAGFIYVNGYTLSTDFGTRNAAQSVSTGGGDHFAARLSPTGEMIFCTYLGGRAREELGRGFVDSGQNLYVIGTTWSGNYPIANAFQPEHGGAADVEVTKLSPQGELVFSTYLGGSSLDLITNAVEAPDGSFIVTGETTSSDIPLVNPFRSAQADLFVLRISSNGTVVYSTYIGGNGTDKLLAGNGVTVDQAGNAYLFGETNSSDFPLVNGGSKQPQSTSDLDFFIMRLGAQGTVSFSTCVGGNSLELNGFPLLSTTGRVVFFGQTRSSDFPLINAVQSNLNGEQDLFVTAIETQ